MDLIKNEYQVIIERKNEKAEGSYTAYLFEQGIDKILKKVGEECTEMVITPEDIEAELEKRAAKRGNLKKFHQVDKNS